MTDDSVRSTARGIDAERRGRRDQWAAYRHGEHPSYRLVLETRCPDCRSSDPSYQYVLEHEPCGCIRPFEAFADTGGCPDCGGVRDATVIARLYTCSGCRSSFDTPVYRLTGYERSAPTTSGHAPGFDVRPTLERDVEADETDGPVETSGETDQIAEITHVADETDLEREDERSTVAGVGESVSPADDGDD